MATAYRGEDAQAPEQTKLDEQVAEAGRAIVGRLAALASDQVSRRMPIETRWIEDLRNYFGYYTDVLFKQLTDAERSTAFVKLTRAKTDAWAARIADLLFPTDDKNWGIAPTPLPKLIEAAKNAVEIAKQSVDQANQAVANNNQPAADVMLEQANAFARAAQQSESEMQEARKRSERMSEAIDDQLVQSRWVAQSRDVIEDGCRLGTGVIKGPLTSNRLRQEWRPGPDGEWMLHQLPDPQPEAVRVDPWHFFPDMSARTIAEAEFTFERSLPTKKDLRRFAMKLGFNKAAVRKLLEEGPGVVPQNDVAHLAQLGAITGEGGDIRDRYVMWEYHGPLECNEIAMLLRAAGRVEDAERYEERKDPLEEPRVIVHFCNTEVLRIAEEWALDSGEGLYSVWNFSKGETSVFGVGVPRIMADSQKAINGAWRMMMDNSGLSVGPQIVIDKAAITPQDGKYDLKPLKVWLKSGTHLSTQQPPFQVYNIPNNQQQLAGIIEMGKMFIDEETAMPQIAQGEMGAQVQPVGTTSMMFNSANVVFRRIVKAWDDDITQPTIGRFYQWNMQFNPDESVKGDMQVDARGTAVLLVKEMQSQNLLMIMNQWTVHPVIKYYIKIHDGLKKAVQTMMIPHEDILETEDVARAAMERDAQAAQQQGGTDPMQVRKEIAEMDGNTRLQIAQMQHEVKVMELSQAQGVSIADINAQLEKERLKIESAERRHAADIAVEERRAVTAEQQGQPASEGTGQGVG